jgi:hypothetical protein
VKRAAGVVSLLLTLSACGAAPPPSARAADTARAKLERTTLWCAETRLSARGHVCIRPLSSDEQRHRSLSLRLEVEAGLPVRLSRVNGRGFADPDDNGCVEHRYRFESGYVTESTGYGRDGTVCDRSLYTAQATQLSHVDAWGRPDFSRERLHTKMLLSFDANGMVVAQRPLASDGTPTTIQQASELRYERDALKLEKSVCYFDAGGKATRNAFGIHCWRSERDQFGGELKRSAWDETGKPAVGGEGAHSYVRQFDRYGNLVRQTALDVDGKPVTLESARCPVLSYVRDEFGALLGVDCLDGSGKPARFDDGNSAWRATPDARGLPREYRYFDEQGNAFAPKWGYARLEVERDALGHIVERRYFTAEDRPGQQKDGPPVTRGTFNHQHLEVVRNNLSDGGSPWHHKGCAALSYEYDEFRQITRSTCRGANGKPALSWSNVATTISRYDARGLLVETQYLGADGKPIDSDDGYQRKLFTYDARGVDGKARHFKASGAELTLRRFAILWVKPPLADGFWAAPSRALAVKTIETAQRELLSGTSWYRALMVYGDDKVYPGNPGDTGYLNLDTVYAAVRAVLEPLKVGEYSRIVEMPYGLAIYLRTE